MEILHEEIKNYISSFSKVVDPVLQEMEEYGKSVDFPYVEPEVGRLLMLFARSINAQRIFELGSGFGYSAAWFLKALPPDSGEIICTDFSDENITRGSMYCERLGANGRVTYMKGDAVESLAKTEGLFDIIYNDIDKTGYPRAFEQALPRLRSGGLFIADNVLWKGWVVGAEPDENTRAIQKFNEMIFDAPDVISVIIPLRDGVSVSLKL